MTSAFDKFARVSALRPAMKRARPVNVTSAPAAGTAGSTVSAQDALCRLLSAASERTHYGEHLLVRRWYAQPEPCLRLNGALELLAPGAVPAAADPANWLFLDTETTGLAGGTGTYAFLVGVAWWDGAGLQVEQFFLRDYADEHSMLTALAARLTERPVLVTFNGKSFDWPLLETRYRMTRSIPIPAPAAHLDLLHPARQLWRLRLGSVRLAELERSVLGAPSSFADWDRAADVRSDMIPHIYFDFLRGGSPVPLLDVFRHNQMDLRGLAAIAAKVVALLDAPEAADAEALELYGISKLVRRRGHPGRSRRLYERALASGLPVAVDRAARRELAALAKRERDFARATALWEDLAGNAATVHCHPERSIEKECHPESALADEGSAFFCAVETAPSVAGAPSRTGMNACPTLDAVEACEQLAMHYEHRARDPHRALELTSEALAALRRAARTGLITPEKQSRLRARLEHRGERLQRKTAQPPSHLPM